MSRSIRQKRASDLLQAEIGRVLRADIRDPRLNLVTITRINVDRELDYANIWVCAPQGDVREADVMAALNKAGGFIRHQIAQRVRLRKVPKFRFHWDLTPDQSEHLHQMLDTLNPSTAEQPHQKDDDQ